MYYKRSRSSVIGQGHSVKTSSDRQIIALFKEIGIAESNGDVRILIGSSGMAVCAHAQYKCGQKQPRTTSATSGGLQVAMHSQLPRFLVTVVLFRRCMLHHAGRLLSARMALYKCDDYLSYRVRQHLTYLA